MCLGRKIARYAALFDRAAAGGFRMYIRRNLHGNQFEKGTES